MEEQLQEKINKLAKQLQANSYSKGKSWNGYEVYIPEYKERLFIGLPYVILVKDGKARISTEDESMEYLNYSEPVENENNDKSTPAEKQRLKDMGISTEE